MTVLVRLVLFILVFDQVLLVPSLQVNLLRVDQLRDQGIVINDVPFNGYVLTIIMQLPTAFLRGLLFFGSLWISFRCCKPTRKKLWINLILSMLI